MSIVSFDGTNITRPRIGSVRVGASGDPGSLESVVTKRGQTGDDWTYEMGVVGYVLRCTRNNRIHLAYDTDELDSFDEDVPSGRTSAVNEIGVIGMSSVPKKDEAGNRKKYNLYFIVTNQNGNRVADTVYIELYDRIV